MLGAWSFCERKISLIAYQSRRASLSARFLGVGAMLIIGMVLGWPTLVAAKAKPVPYGAPVKLMIPKIGVKAVVEYTGIDRRGALEAPQDPMKVGWYRHGAQPGGQGNAVMGGHLNWYTGPGVFQSLGRLRTGDTVEVVNDFGKTLRFRVTRVATYQNGAIPLKDIAGKTTGIHLNLYTCTGTYNRSQRNYSHRVVVYTELVRTKKPT